MVLHGGNEGGRDPHSAPARTGLTSLLIVGAIALCGAWFAWTYLGPRNPNVTGYQPPVAPSHDRHAGGNACDPNYLARLPNVADSLNQAEHCIEISQDKQRAEEALNQGARTANATEQATLIAYGQECLVFWQTYAAIWAFIAAGGAVYFAKRAADAGNDAVEAANATLEHARKSSEQELRAYVHSDKFTSTFAPPKTPHTHCFIICGWTNAGKTPAKRALNDTNFQFFDGEMPPDFDFPDQGEATYETFGIGPGQTLYNFHHRFELDEIIALKFEDRRRLYYWGWIEYDDVFERTKRRRTEFCVRVRLGTNQETGEMSLVFQGHTRHNGTDDDCMKQPTPYQRPA